MPVFYDLTKDIRFKEGLEGKARTSTIRLLNQGVPTVAMITEGLDVPLTFVLKIQNELEKKTNLK